MHCTKCGREIGTKSSCPYCGTAQKMANPFVTLGDLRPHDADTDSTVSGPIISDSGDPFRMLGNLDGSPISRRDFVLDAPSVGGFVPVGNLDGSPIDQEDTTMDTPGTGGFKPLVTVDVSSTSRTVERLDPLGGGGFKPLGQGDEYFVSGKTQCMDPPGRGGFRPMHETIPTNGGSSGAYEKDLPEVPGTLALHIQWKRWIPTAVGIIVVCLLFWAVCSDSLPIMNGKYAAETAENALGQVLEAPILEVNTDGIETPAFLYSIESRNGYELLSFEKTNGGAVATMRVFAPDVYSVAKDLDSSNTYTNADILMNQLDSALRTAPLVEKQVVVEYILTKEGYVPVLTVEFLDAYYGGIYQLRDEMIADAAAEAEG